METENHYSAIIESLLFASEKPLSVERIQAVIKDITPDGIEQAINSLNEKYQTGEHCFAIKRIARGYQMYTLPDFAPWIKALFTHTRREKLSFPALEVLSIIAYKQPIVKSEIDRFRGVNSEGPVFTLLDRKLITIVGRKPAPGRPLLYGTTQDFLTHFGLNDLDDLPKMEELEAILKRREAPVFDLEPTGVEPKPEEAGPENFQINPDQTIEETEKSSPESGEAEAQIPITIPADSSSPDHQKMRLNKFLARSGVCSRRNADILIQSGRVKVNDVPVQKLGISIDEIKDRVTVDGKEIQIGGKSIYILLNKPPGYLSTVKDNFNRPTVLELVGKEKESFRWEGWTRILKGCFF